MWAGFWINSITATALLVADATTKFANPVFFFIVLAGVNVDDFLRGRPVAQSRALGAGADAPAVAKTIAAVSLFL